MKNKNNDLSDSKQKQTESTEQTPQQNNKNDNSSNRIPPSVLGEKAEDYLREQANVEDMSDEKDEVEYDKKIANAKKENNKNKDRNR